jgi:hypothetical protein
MSERAFNTVVQSHPLEEQPATLEMEALSVAIEQFNTELTADFNDNQIDCAVTRFLNDVQIWDVLADNAANTAGMRQVVHAMNILETATGNNGSYFLKVAGQVDTPVLAKTLGELFGHDDADLHQVLERAVDVEPSSYSAEKDFIQLVATIVHPTHSTMLHWDDYDPKYPTLPAFMDRLRKRPYFARICLEDELARIQELETETARKQIRYTRDVEIGLLEDILGLSEAQSREYRFAIEARTIGVPEGGMYGDDPELDLEAWETAIRRYVDHVEHFGLERIKQLRDDWGIINLDRYTRRQLDRMCRLSDGDPVLLAKLQNGDVTLVSSDAFGDPENAMAADVERLETDDDLTLYSEIISPHSMYSPLVRLATKYGVKPSTWAVSTHGNIGYMGFGRGARKHNFHVVPDASIWGKEKAVQVFGIDSSQVARLLRNYMQPHSETGERSVVFLCCKQAVPDSEETSTALTVACVTEPEDRVVVTAWEQDLAWGGENTRQLWDELDDVPAVATIHRKVADGVVETTKGYDVPGLRLAA